jgi:toxin ParE1/3/4
MAIESLTECPEILGTKAREALGASICTLHAARNSRKARHFVDFRVAEDQVLDVLRVL